jgi:hypothetical protein
MVVSVSVMQVAHRNENKKKNKAGTSKHSLASNRPKLHAVDVEIYLSQAFCKSLMPNERIGSCERQMLLGISIS